MEDRPNAPRGARERARAAVMGELLASARARLGTDGPAHLSLRAVARDLGVSSSAVYRYVESRDALLTLLIVEAYDAVGEVAESAAAHARAGGSSPAQTWLAVARGVRAWALANPHSFELIYGTPVPGYQAPQDTVAAAVRIWAVIVSIMLEGFDDGSLAPTGPDFDPDGLVTAEALAFAGMGAPQDVPTESARAVVRSFTLFASLIGGLTAELYGHLHRVADDFPGVFDAMIATAAAGVGLHVDLLG
ncbi:MAG TPA: TetR/AcrR family transcriptional regulator [Cellulomonas sp.]|uniref:TetR/AcrR family transcriptional regulator n=1 Tax=Cellulomonas sp. TaxID=40001 RepID=UPI002E33059E|nr:TetR/AcrR family transcriptional regulator [Cellulomonas sp.]HEX5333816.1 TetR/AcrR family transcriptional regulator [Cellulomonas sp.]